MNGLSIFNLKIQKSYNQETLLNDRSIRWKGFDKSDVLARIKESAKDALITRLRHPEVRYEVTDHCNAECIMCPRESHKLARPHGIMDMEQYKKSVDEVTTLGCRQVVLTSFGEPLIDKRLEAKIEYAKSKGLRTYIITNASLLTRERTGSLIKAGLDEIRVSYYGMTKASYEKVMVGLNFDVTMDNLKGFFEIREKLGSRLPRMEISWLELPENSTETGAFQEYWEHLADAIEIWRPHNFGDGRSYRQRFEERSLKTSCGRPENGPLQIQWNGEVIPCCYDYNNQVSWGMHFSNRYWIF